MNELFGCKITPFSKAKALVDWVNGGAAVEEAARTKWLLAHCDDGIVWGKFKQDKWELSSEPFPRISPKLTIENVQQLRLFEQEREFLAWRTDDGLQGRVLADTGNSGIESDRQPIQECQILIGDRLLDGPSNGFSVVGEAGGSRHAVPVPCEAEDFKKDERPYWPLRLAVRHYLTRDRDSGAVRVAASRLVNVYKVEKRSG